MVSNKFLTNKSYTIIGCDKDNIFHKGKQRVNTLHGGCFASTPLLSFFFLFSPIKCFASSLESRLWVDEGMVIVFPNSLRTIRLAGVFSEVDEHSNYVLWWSSVFWIFWDKRVGSVIVPRQLISIFTCFLIYFFKDSPCLQHMIAKYLLLCLNHGFGFSIQPHHHQYHLLVYHLYHRVM